MPNADVCSRAGPVGTGHLMRNLALAVALIGTSLPTVATKRLTVEELEQMLTAQKTVHKADSAIAEELGSLELTEELTAPTLDRISAEVQAGPQTTQALELLADASVLLAPPAGELPAIARPDMAMQRADERGNQLRREDAASSAGFPGDAGDAQF
jgi:hypothetical protein